MQRRYEASAYARNFLERQIAKTRADLEKSERQLVAYAQAQGIINTSVGEEGKPAGDTNSLQGESLIALNQALAEATARRVAAEGAYRAGIAVGATSDVTASTQVLRQSRAALEAEYQDKRTLMKPDHPDMLSLRSRINELDRQIARETSQASSGRTNTLLAEYRGALAAENALQGRVASLKGSVLDLRGRSIQYTILQREVDTNRSLYDALLQRYKEVGVAGGIGTSPVSIVDRAEVPGGPYKPNLLLNLLLGLGLGLVGGIAAAVALEYLYDTIKTRDDVRHKLGLACLGAIPKTAGQESFIEELKDPRSVVSEAYSAVVASLRFSTEEGLPKTVGRHQHPVGRGQIIVGVGGCAEFRAARRIGAADRQRPQEAGLQGGFGQGRPDPAADQRRGSGAKPYRPDPVLRPVADAERSACRPIPPTSCRPDDSRRSSARSRPTSTSSSSMLRR